MVAKAVISTVIKTAAQAVINHQIDREAGNSLLGSVLKLGVGAAQYALTKADTRAWVNLPNTIQMAVVDKPKDNVLQMQAEANGATIDVDLPAGENVLVVVKSAGLAGKPAVYAQALPAVDQVAGL